MKGLTFEKKWVSLDESSNALFAAGCGLGAAGRGIMSGSKIQSPCRRGRGAGGGGDDRQDQRPTARDASAFMAAPVCLHPDQGGSLIEQGSSHQEEAETDDMMSVHLACAHCILTGML